MTTVALEPDVNSSTIYPRSRVIRMNAVATGLVMGIVAGLALFVATNWLVLKGGDVVGPHLALLGQIYYGYKVTFIGSLIGFVYAGFTGFAAGYAGARLYNVVSHWGQQ